MTRIYGSAMAALMCLSLSAVPAIAGTQDAAMKDFTHRVKAYMELRRHAAERVPPLSLSWDLKTLAATSDALADEIRAARPAAKVGDIFSPEIVVVFQDRIGAALRRHAYDAADVLYDVTSDAPALRSVAKVNGRFDWTFGALMPGCVITALPPLPDELQYRFVGQDLVLVDIDAGLIVDILPLALSIN
jgi:hypothetical protein